MLFSSSLFPNLPVCFSFDNATFKSQPKQNLRKIKAIGKNTYHEGMLNINTHTYHIINPFIKYSTSTFNWQHLHHAKKEPKNRKCVLMRFASGAAIN
jgi:hypothetical protein